MSLAHQIMLTGEQPIPSLIRYDAACKALAEAKSVDDVKDIRDRAEAMRAYAKQAKNKQLEVDAAEIRIRAERRLGQMIEAQKEAVGLHQGGRPKTGFQENPVSLPTLAEAGVDKNLANRARKMAAIPEAEFGEIVSEWRGRVEKENERVSVNLLKSGERHSAAQAQANTISDEDREYRDLQKAWDAAGEIARGRFLEANDISFTAEPEAAAEVAGNDLREPVAAGQGQIIREGDAPRETDCQAGEASQGGSDASGPDTEFVSQPVATDQRAAATPADKGRGPDHLPGSLGNSHKDVEQGRSSPAAPSSLPASRN